MGTCPSVFTMQEVHSLVPKKRVRGLDHPSPPWRPGAAPGKLSSALGDNEVITCLRVFFLAAKSVFSDPCYLPSRKYETQAIGGE